MPLPAIPAPGPLPTRRGESGTRAKAVAEQKRPPSPEGAGGGRPKADPAAGSARADGSVVPSARHAAENRPAYSSITLSDSSPGISERSADTVSTIRVSACSLSTPSRSTNAFSSFMSRPPIFSVESRNTSVIS